MKGNFTNLVKEIDIPVQEAQRVPKKLEPRKNTPKHIIITLSKIKDKETILKQHKERRQLPMKEFQYAYQLSSQKTPYRQEGAGKK